MLILSLVESKTIEPAYPKRPFQWGKQLMTKTGIWRYIIWYIMVYHGTPHFGPTNLSKTHRAPNPKDSQLIAQLLQRRCIDEIHRFAERPRATRPQVEDVEICGRCEMLATITLVQTL